MPNLSTFLENARANNAVVFLDGAGDSRYRRNGHGEMYGSASALYRACGGFKGVMMSFNINSSEWANDGFVRAGRRTSGGNLVVGFKTSKPSGTTGVTGPIATQAEAVTLSGTLAETSLSGGTFTLAGAYADWPTSNFYIEMNGEVILVTSRSSATCTLLSATTVATQGSLSGTGTGTFTITSTTDWPLSGTLRIDSEDIDFTRSGSTITMTVRGARGSTAASHLAGAAVAHLDANRGQYATRKASHTNGNSVRLYGPLGLSWLGPQHMYLHHSTVATQGSLSGTGTGTFTIQAADAVGWPIGQHVVKIDNEYILCTRYGVTITMVTRGYWGSTAASHTATTAVGIADWNPYSVIQIHSRSPIGNFHALQYAAVFENPTGAVVASASVQPSIYTVGNFGEDAVTSVGSELGSITAVNPTTSSAAGTIGGVSCSCPPSTTDTRSIRGVACGLSLKNPSSGPILAIWQYAGAHKRGGMVQVNGPSAGGRRLFELVSGILRTTGRKAELVKKFQSMRWFASSANKGSNKVRLVYLIDYASNDSIDTSLCFVTVSKSWTYQYEKQTTTAVTDSATSITLADVTGIPTSGHAVNASTGERFSWTGISTNTLTGVTRGDFGTTAVAMAVGDKIRFGWQNRDPLGLPATVYFYDQLLRELWDASDISSANASYPFETSGSTSMLAAGTGTPDADTELMTLFVRPPCVRDTISAVAAGGALDTYEKLEGRYRDWVNNVRTYVSSASTMLDVVDFGPDIMSAEEQCGGGYGDIATSTTLNGTITDSATSLVLTSTSGMQSQGFVWIDSECILYNGISGNTLQNLSRGKFGTTAASHTNGAATVSIDPVHQSAAGSGEIWARWAAKNVAGAGGTGAVEYSSAALRAAVGW